MAQARLTALTFALLTAPGWALCQAFDLPYPAEVAAQDGAADGVFSFPLGPADQGAPMTQTTTGPWSRTAWQVADPDLSSDALIAPVLRDLEGEGFEVLYTCAASACGSFTFRKALDLLPAPKMFVALNDYHYAVAENKSSGIWVAAVASRTASLGFLHITRIGSDAAIEASANPVQTLTPFAIDQADLDAALESQGRYILTDLTFDRGSSALGDGDFASLQDLSAYLARNPDLTVALVGHTDSEGSLEVNIRLSRARAASVKARLETRYGVAAGQLEAQGMGYLAPIASNRTEAGRDKNRRVEVIVTSTR